jgi:transcriptional regulator GlxA family with amidase domain
MRFLEITGHSIGSEIRSARLRLAKDLLGRKSIPVGLIAGRCGYKDERSLRLLFKKATGLSPREWRNQSLQTGK